MLYSIKDITPEAEDKDKLCGPYRAMYACMAIQFYLLKRTTLTVKLAGPKVSVI